MLVRHLPLLVCIACWSAVRLLAQDAQPAPSPTPAAPGLTESYVLRPQDVLDVRVHSEDDLNRVIRIDADGRITLPLIGQLQVAGKTVTAVESEIRAAYDRDFLVNPQVNVSVVEYARRFVSVLGSVNAPGQVEIPPEQRLSLVEAIARTGGFSRLANQRSVVLSRKNPDGTNSIRTIDVRDMLSGRSQEQIDLRDGDVINVPEGLL